MLWNKMRDFRSYKGLCMGFLEIWFKCARPSCTSTKAFSKVQPYTHFLTRHWVNCDHLPQRKRIGLRPSDKLGVGQVEM